MLPTDDLLAKLTKLTENERLTRALAEEVRDYNEEWLIELADNATALNEAVIRFNDAAQGWEDVEGNSEEDREERADYKAEAIDAADEIVQATQTLSSLLADVFAMWGEEHGEQGSQDR